MAQDSPPLVFVSYDHHDRDRVAPLVARLKRRRWEVWWDPRTRIGAEWREVIDDRLRHARCVIVVWSRSSVKSRWVRDEAESAAERGVLMPVRIDRVRAPRGFGEFHYADLEGWESGPSAELDRLLKSVAALLAGALALEPWRRLEGAVAESRNGAGHARDFVRRVRARTAMFKRAPEAAAALGTALAGVAQTYAAVDEALDDFLAPAVDGGKLTVARYRPLATGRLVADIEARRGHCTRIGQAYIEADGLRDGLPDGTDGAVIAALDTLFLELSTADHDLFKAMTAVGAGLANESSAVVNLLLAGQRVAAQTRVASAERQLAPLVRAFNDGRAELHRLAGELGIVVDDALGRAQRSDDDLGRMPPTAPG